MGSFAARLKAAGVMPGDRVGAYLPNTPQAVVAFLACASAAALVPVGVTPHDFNDWTAGQPGNWQPDWRPFDHALWVVYSSGTAGLPKPIVHGHNGIVLGGCTICLFDGNPSGPVSSTAQAPDWGTLWRFAAQTGAPGSAPARPSLPVA